MDYPLAGLKVLDFSRVLAGPFAGRMLSDLGADVIKVEPPDGDVTRFWGREVANIPGYFHQQNVGKRNICIDMRADGAADLVKELVRHADILIENYRPDVMGRLGIGYEDLQAVNPALIMLSISGFGKDGPEVRRAAYAPVIHAESGLIQRMASESSLTPHDLPLSVADTNASLHGLVGVLSALHLRARTGEGQHVDIAMIDATVATDDKIHYDLDGARGTGPLQNEIWALPFGTVLISTDFRLMFKLLTRQGYITDPADADTEFNEKIRLRRETVMTFMDTMTDIETFTEVMKKINVAWGEVRDPTTIADQVTIKARGTITEVDDRAGGKRQVTQSPYRFSNAASGVRGPAAHRGEHNNEIMQEWLGQDDATTNTLHEKGVLIYDPDWRHH